MITETYILNSIEHAAIIGKTLNKSWFRGHDRICNALVPKVFRKNYTGLETEFSYVEDFKRFAPVLEKTLLPSRYDHFPWLVQMQHHGVPTRLLDWTESIFVALYFIVSEKPKQDGELWVMNPYDLNECHKNVNLYGIATIDNLLVNFLAAQPMYRDDADSQKTLAEGFELEPEDIPKYPISVQCPMMFPRMVSQLSTFTIHTSPKEKTIPELLPKKTSLVRYIVPSGSKKEIRGNLFSLGIRKGTLFQDLDSLSSDLTYKIRSMGKRKGTLPEPPTCGGEYCG